MDSPNLGENVTLFTNIEDIGNCDAWWRVESGPSKILEQRERQKWSPQDLPGATLTDMASSLNLWRSTLLLLPSSLPSNIKLNTMHFFISPLPFSTLF
ncbi:hypothetical protein Csa_010620 [Cucumis sativus]|uniref:Uncharacterized protein n=1 Tax=Cucumis sativus TaxID=3659 RepID=A0A0A0L4V9_CUCSA|nr:hypothetical protein Csa_010620 [Cucumis sativus]